MSGADSSTPPDPKRWFSEAMARLRKEYGQPFRDLSTDETAGYLAAAQSIMSHYVQWQMFLEPTTKEDA